MVFVNLSGRVSMAKPLTCRTRSRAPSQKACRSTVHLAFSPSVLLASLMMPAAASREFCMCPALRLIACRFTSIMKSGARPDPGTLVVGRFSIVLRLLKCPLTHLKLVAHVSMNSLALSVRRLFSSACEQ